MTYKTQKFCTECGHQLTYRVLQGEGELPYCQRCQVFRFPVFNTAVSCIILNDEDKYLLIKQYGKPDFILTAGYIGQGENAEDTVRREIKEELNLDVVSLAFNKSSYFQASNTLMLNFVVKVAGEVTPNHEVDDWAWFEQSAAVFHIKEKSLAKHFLLHYLES